MICQDGSEKSHLSVEAVNTLSNKIFYSGMLLQLADYDEFKAVSSRGGNCFENHSISSSVAFYYKIAICQFWFVCVAVISTQTNSNSGERV